MSETRRPLLGFLASLAVCLGLLTLIAFDDEKTFEWILARLLGLDFLWILYASFVWAKATGRFNDFFAWALAGEFMVRLIDATAFRYFPPFYILILASGPVLSLLYAGGLRESTKSLGWDEKRTWMVCFGGGILMHYMLIGALVEAVFSLLRGSYP